MASHRGGLAGAIGLVLVLAGAGCGLQGSAGTGAAHHRGQCSAGAHTLSAPRAHEASQLNPVGGPDHNPLPPACTPELTSTSAANQNAKNGTQCPANKLVVTPAAPIGDGAV